MPEHFTFQNREYSSPVAVTVGAIQGKWKAMILWNLRDEILRYGELRNRLVSVTDKMLAQQLRELERDGLIHREMFAVIPPRTEYSLTDEGRTLLPILVAMEQWGLRHKVQEKHNDK